MIVPRVAGHTASYGGNSARTSTPPLWEEDKTAHVFDCQEDREMAPWRVSQRRTRLKDLQDHALRDFPEHLCITLQETDAVR
jgi:hypothetical protein